MTEPDLAFLGDDVRVRGAMLLRLDSAVMPAQAAILEGLRAINAQITL